MHAFLAVTLLACGFAVRGVRAQPPAAPLTRAAALDAALRTATRLGVARADTAVAFAQLVTARARPDPTASVSYSESTPRYHAALDVPLDYPRVRGARVRAAQAGRQVAHLRFAAARAAAALDADTAYTRALAARERVRLSRRNAQDADSLRGIAARRRDAGDASDLDVELATINAGQQANTAAGDSLAYVSAVLDLQAAIGLAADAVVVAPVDSLVPPPIEASAGPDGVVPNGVPSAPRVVAAVPRAPASPSASPSGASPSGARPAPTSPASVATVSATASAGTPGAPLSVAAAQGAVEAARLSALAERRNVWATPSLTAGFETGDPGGQRGILPTVGVAIPLPVLNRNRGPIALAEAEGARARAELAQALVESRTEIARARRTVATALAKVRRDQTLVAAADRVAARSLTAYPRGAFALPAVLEAQRNARDVLAQYVADVADALVAAGVLRALTLTAPSDRP